MAQMTPYVVSVAVASVASLTASLTAYARKRWHRVRDRTRNYAHITPPPDVRRKVL